MVEESGLGTALSNDGCLQSLRFMTCVMDHTFFLALSTNTELKSLVCVDCRLGEAQAKAVGRMLASNTTLKDPVIDDHWNRNKYGGLGEEGVAGITQGLAVNSSLSFRASGLGGNEQRRLKTPSRQIRLSKCWIWTLPSTTVGKRTHKNLHSGFLCKTRLASGEPSRSQKGALSELQFKMV